MMKLSKMTKIQKNTKANKRVQLQPKTKEYFSYGKLLKGNQINKER